ncbi:hypothetical protein AKJ37_00065 [candidate division MSBL1 archaeon SCGC-AAA259I09]|uniref:FAD-binding domain-containing protein n=2 Tax=candidate division MSBL1 TaxID=215777 RepID=A0A133UW23_9EURY|nr:hypothetical protein AKJ36_03440 [candidate division MSBL1 archaeon SCGC-AAA259I07]KXA98397.1 hypothetical protein AKJ37_00065 [candidate division MSBL1 archaeon SCGC-AAA259I09]
MRDVIIVGGGPAGCFTGERLAEKGFRVTIVEEHGEIGQPMCCAGIIGAERFKETGIDPEKWSVNELKEGVFHSPPDKSTSLTRNETEAYVIDRSNFDRCLAERAARAGADIRLGSRCIGASRSGDRVSIKVKNREKEETLDSRVVIGADGANSIIARRFDLINDFSPIIGAQAEIVGSPTNSAAHVFLGNDLSKNFFAWVVPAGEVYRVGLGDKKTNVRKKLLEFIKNSPILPENSRARIVNFTTGLIPKAGGRKVYGDRVLLVGDAAGHVKPLTGGGLYLGLSCAGIAGDVLAESLADEPCGENLQEYEKLVVEKFGQEFELGERALRIFQNMADEDISEFFEFLEEPRIKDMVLENAAFDRHSELLKMLIKEGPELFRKFGFRRLLKYLTWLR